MDLRASFVAFVTCVAFVAFVAALACVVTLAALAVVPSTARAEDPEEAAKTAELVLRQRLAGVLNPMGAEHYAELAGRMPIGDPSSILFMGAHVEIGALTALSPVYAVGGGYVEISPLSFLVLRGQVTGFGLWPIGMQGAGYYALGRYDEAVASPALAADQGRTATGFMAAVSGTLQGMVPLGDVQLLVLDELAFEYAELGQGAFYYDQRNDIVRARADWLVTNNAFLGLELDVDRDVLFRVGVYDDFRNVPAAGLVANQIGPIAMFAIARPDASLAAIEPFLRAGYYTNHPGLNESGQHFREGTFTVLGGVQVRYDLGAIR